jgi:hypothetical protein
MMDIAIYAALGTGVMIALCPRRDPDIHSLGRELIILVVMQEL